VLNMLLVIDCDNDLHVPPVCVVVAESVTHERERVYVTFGRKENDYDRNNTRF